MFGRSGLATISAGLNIPRDSMMSVLILKVAVAVRASQDTFGKILARVPSFPWDGLKSFLKGKKYSRHPEPRLLKPALI